MWMHAKMKLRDHFGTCAYEILKYNLNLVVFIISYFQLRLFYKLIYFVFQSKELFLTEVNVEYLWEVVAIINKVNDLSMENCYMKGDANAKIQYKVRRLSNKK